MAAWSCFEVAARAVCEAATSGYLPDEGGSPMAARAEVLAKALAGGMDRIAAALEPTSLEKLPLGAVGLAQQALADAVASGRVPPDPAAPFEARVNTLADALIVGMATLVGAKVSRADLLAGARHVIE